MKVAIIHDWLVGYAGGEKVLEQMLNLYPDADLFSLFDFLSDDQRFFIKNKTVTTSFLQKFPFAKNKYRNYLPLMPLAIEQFDLSEYDLVLSSSAAISKGVITGPDQLHICYCHSPVRYAWDLQFQYLQDSGLSKGVRSWLTRLMLHKIRQWDDRTSNGVDEFIANSRFISRRIHKVYRRSSTVIHPPVDTGFYGLAKEKDDYYLAASRLVPYKKMEVIVEAFAHMPDKRLVVIGNGPCMQKVKSVATRNIEILGYLDDANVLKYMQKAKAFVFAALEDFGIMPVEAQACGTPVIALGRGGILDSVVNGKTGLFFQNQEVADIMTAVKEFERYDFDSLEIRQNAEKFSIASFQENYSKFVAARWSEFEKSIIS